MNASLLDPDPFRLAVEAPAPVLLNTWKHHAGAQRRRIAEFSARGDEGLLDLAESLVVIGTELMDVYTGQLSPWEIAGRVVARLAGDQLLDESAYRVWLDQSAGYQVINLEDQSRWVLRLGEAGGRYVHLHPARWAPQTRRVRANVLKSAVMILAHVRTHGGSPWDLALVNRVREDFLGLGRVRELAGDQGLGSVLELLQGEEGD